MAGHGHRPDRRRRRWFVGLVVALLAVSALLHAARAVRGRDARRARERYAALVAARPIAAARARRGRYYQVRYFLAYPTAVSLAAADLARRLHAAAPPLQLQWLQVDPGLHGLDFTAAVRPPGGNRRAARRRFAAFLERVTSIPGVYEAGPGPGAATDGVRGRLELP